MTNDLKMRECEVQFYLLPHNWRCDITVIGSNFTINQNYLYKLTQNSKFQKKKKKKERRKIKLYGYD